MYLHRWWVSFYWNHPLLTDQQLNFQNLHMTIPLCWLPLKIIISISLHVCAVVQMFHLMPTPQGSFYVLNDIFRLNYAWSLALQTEHKQGLNWTWFPSDRVFQSTKKVLLFKSMDLASSAWVFVYSWPVCGYLRLIPSWDVLSSITITPPVSFSFPSMCQNFTFCWCTAFCSLC